MHRIEAGTHELRVTTALYDRRRVLSNDYLAGRAKWRLLRETAPNGRETKVRRIGPMQHRPTVRKGPPPRTIAKFAEWPAPLDAWRRKTVHGGARDAANILPMFIADAIDATAPALIIPMPFVRRIDGGPGRFAVLPDPAGSSRTLIVWLDAAVLRQQLLEPLVGRYFGTGDASEFLVSIVERDDQSRVVYTSSSGAFVVPSTSEASVLAFGTIQSGTVQTGSGDPAAGILAGYNPANANTPNNNIHGSVSIDDYAAVTAMAGTDGIRGVNYGTGEIETVEMEVAELDARLGTGRRGGDRGVQQRQRLVRRREILAGRGAPADHAKDFRTYPRHRGRHHRRCSRKCSPQGRGVPAWSKLGAGPIRTTGLTPKIALRPPCGNSCSSNAPQIEAAF